MDDKDIFSTGNQNNEPENDLLKKYIEDFEKEFEAKENSVEAEPALEAVEDSQADSDTDASLNSVADADLEEGLNDEAITEDEEESVNESLDLNSFSSGAVDKARKKKVKRKQGKQKILKAILTVVLVGLITFSIVVGSFLFYAFTMVDGTMDVDLNNLELNFTTTIFVKDKETGKWKEYQRLHGEFNRIWVHYDENAAKDKDDTTYEGIPQRLADAFVAIEDKRFYTHFGVDWKRTVGSLINEFIPIYSSRQGGSTITQQLVKNLTDDKEQKASRKVREIMRARYLETYYTKDTILECYLNTIHLGHGLYGVEVAANYYFGKSVDELSLLECASLASIAKSSAYAPDEKDEDGTIGRANKTRREAVLKLMLEEKYITQKEYDEAMKEELKLVASREQLNETEINNYFVDALIVQVTNDLADKYGWDEAHAAEKFYSGGYQIRATLDPDIQETIESVFENVEKYNIEGKNGEQLQGSFTIMDYNGRVLGLVGGIGEKTANLGHSGFNRATDALRQPGSTMKPIAAYAPAIDDGIINYSSILNDTATVYNAGLPNEWIPNNWYNTYAGSVTTQFAIERSINTIPVYLINKLGKQRCYDFVTQRMGITTLTKADMDLSPLGMGGTNGGITTIQSAAAYAVFGNGGKYYEPTLYYDVYDQHGNVVLSNNDIQPTVAISDDTATVMNKMLQTVIYGSRGTGRDAKNFIPNMKIFAKTGTSNLANDLWFVGGSPYYVASCWCGYDQPQEVTDSTIARTMWGAVMSEIHKDLEAKDFRISNYASERFYCPETGLLATDTCPSRAKGWYTKQGTPEKCTTHIGNVLGSPEDVEKAEAEAQKPAEGEEAAKPEGEG